MAEQSSVDIDLDATALPVLPGVVDLARAGVVPGGTRRNLAWVESRIDMSDCDAVSGLILADAQTSGGLLFGVVPTSAEAAVAELRAKGHPAAVVGTAHLGSGQIRVLGRCV
jgi:selenide,water dikinase